MKAKIIYASQTGNTQEIVDVLKENLQDLNVEVDASECTVSSAAEFLNADLCIVATYTYGYGDLPDEIVPLFEELQGLDLSGKVFGTIGSGDMSYDDAYCKSVDDFAQVLLDAGAIKGAESVKIEFTPEGDDYQKIQEFAKELVAHIT